MVMDRSIEEVILGLRQKAYLEEVKTKIEEVLDPIGQEELLKKLPQSGKTFKAAELLKQFGNLPRSGKTFKFLETSPYDFLDEIITRNPGTPLRLDKLPSLSSFVVDSRPLPVSSWSPGKLLKYVPLASLQNSSLVPFEGIKSDYAAPIEGPVPFESLYSNPGLENVLHYINELSSGIEIAEGLDASISMYAVSPKPPRDPRHMVIAYVVNCSMPTTSLQSSLPQGEPLNERGCFVLAALESRIKSWPNSPISHRLLLHRSSSRSLSRFVFT